MPSKKQRRLTWAIMQQICKFAYDADLEFAPLNECCNSFHGTNSLEISFHDDISGEVISYSLEGLRKMPGIMSIPPRIARYISYIVDYSADGKFYHLMRLKYLLIYDVSIDNPQRYRRKITYRYKNKLSSIQFTSIPRKYVYLLK